MIRRLWPFALAGRLPSYLCAAHYFSDGWPLDSLLVFRQPQLRRELRQLRRDGFNAIIVVVPWRGFQTAFSPPQYDAFYVAQLRRVIAAARAQRLAVILRVAYTHQVMLGPSVNGIRFTQRMLTDPMIEAAWLHYHGTVGAIAGDDRCVVGAFVSWEEFWHAFAHWQSLSLAERKDLAERSGYAAYLSAEGAVVEPVIPRRDAPEHAIYLRFVNARIRQLVEAARQRFPVLGIEYRVDKDRVPGEEGDLWQANDHFPDFMQARYAYWAPFMGALNRGERLASDRALASLQLVLNEATEGASLPGPMLEQFNFVDSTRKYADTHARISAPEVFDFLDRAEQPLREMTSGYGIWAPRDYRCNVLYNAAALDRGRGWQVAAGSVRFLKNGGVRLHREAAMVQTLKPKVAGVPRAHPLTALQLRVAYRRATPMQLQARINEGAFVPLLPDTAGGEVTAELAVDFESLFERGLRFEIRNLGKTAHLSRLWLFDQTYFGGVRDEYNLPGPISIPLRNSIGECRCRHSRRAVTNHLKAALRSNEAAARKHSCRR